MRKDKKKVVGEPMTEEQIKAFLHYQPEAGENPDFHLLLRAYRGLREEDFEQFLTYFQAAGHNVHATDPEGKTLLQIISQHRKANPYINALKNL